MKNKKDIIIVVLAVVVLLLLLPGGFIGGLLKISWAIFKFIVIAIALIIVINFLLKKFRK